MKEVMTRTGRYAHLPPMPQLAKYAAENANSLSEVEALDIEDVLRHVETAAAAIYNHLLREITAVAAPTRPATAA